MKYIYKKVDKVEHFGTPCEMPCPQEQQLQCECGNISDMHKCRYCGKDGCQSCMVLFNSQWFCNTAGPGQIIQSECLEEFVDKGAYLIEKIEKARKIYRNDDMFVNFVESLLNL